MPFSASQLLSAKCRQVVTQSTPQNTLGGSLCKLLTDVSFFIRTVQNRDESIIVTSECTIYFQKGSTKGVSNVPNFKTSRMELQ